MTVAAISADSHMDLTYMPHDAFTSRVALKWKQRVPHIVETAEGKVWYGDGKRLARFGYYGPGLNAGKRGALLVTEGFASGEKTSPADPRLRLQDQDCDGTWPESQKAIAEQVAGVDERLKRKMLWANVSRLYDLGL